MFKNKTLPQAFHLLVKEKGISESFVRHYRPTKEDRYFSQKTKDFWDLIEQMGAALLKLELKRGEKVAIISDNCPEWLIVDFAVMSLGSLDVPRGTDATNSDLTCILTHSESTLIFVENENVLKKILSIKKSLPYLKSIICMDQNHNLNDGVEESIKILNFKDVLEMGKQKLSQDPECFIRELKKGKRDDSATIIYTSGTTGEPKGVELAHESFLFQIERIGELLKFPPQAIYLNALPIWHSFERAVEYILLFQGGSLAYSKLVPSVLLKDIEEINPHCLVFVPRVWENIKEGVFRKIQDSSLIKQKLFYFFYKTGKIYRHFESIIRKSYPNYTVGKESISSLLKRFSLIIPFLLLKIPNTLGDKLIFSTIRKRLGKNFSIGISGGGALPSSIDDFYRIINVKVLEGYGLTELGPVINVRNWWKPIYHTVGPFLRDVKFKVIDEDGRSLKTGEKGELWVKTPQIMKGYYKRPDLTSQVITANGWFKTGDLVRKTANNEISIVGRIKDTIVLRGGKNIEPEPIEKALLESRLIENVVIVGQDEKFLGALIVPAFENLKSFLKKEKNLVFQEPKDIIEHPEVLKIYRQILQETICTKRGFSSYESITNFSLLPKAFEINQELTSSLKVRRNVVKEIYKESIANLFKT